MGKIDLVNGYDLFVLQTGDVEVAFPSLKKELGDDGIFLKGTLDIVDGYGKYWDNYEVEIHYKEGFPNRFPSLLETGDKIPKLGDWHIYEDTLSCCIKIEPLEILKCLNGITLVDFIREEVLPYLFNQTHRRIEGYYVNGEFSHGAIGLFEFYAEELKTDFEIKKTVIMIDFIANNSRPDRRSNCFCGSNIKFRHCHREMFDNLKKIGDETLKFHAYLIGKAAELF